MKYEIELPFFIGDTVYVLVEEDGELGRERCYGSHVVEVKIIEIRLYNTFNTQIYGEDFEFELDEFVNKYVFKTKEEAESKIISLQ